MFYVTLFNVDYVNKTQKKTLAILFLRSMWDHKIDYSATSLA